MSRITKSRKSLIIFYDNKNLLIQNRKAIKKSFNLYGFFGGSIEQGETPAQALKREVMEELTIRLENFRLMKSIMVKNNEIDKEWYIYVAPMPDLNKIIVKEGEPYLTTIEQISSLDISDDDKQIIKDLKIFIN